MYEKTWSNILIYGESWWTCQIVRKFAIIQPPQQTYHNATEFIHIVGVVVVVVDVDVRRFLDIFSKSIVSLVPQGPTKVGTGNGDPEVPELPSVQGYSWATLYPGGVNTETCSSRLGVGREADNLTL
jgi:hypothetical protein